MAYKIKNERQLSLPIIFLWACEFQKAFHVEEEKKKAHNSKYVSLRLRNKSENKS